MAETFSYTTDYTVQKTVKPKILKNDFGDGYTQRASAGLNPDPEMWSLSWNGRISATVDAIEAFFIARAGHEAFYWTPPREGSTRLFTCPEWRREYVAAGNDNITAKFEEVFDLNP